MELENKLKKAKNINFYDNNYYEDDTTKSKFQESNIKNILCATAVLGGGIALYKSDVARNFIGKSMELLSKSSGELSKKSNVIKKWILKNYDHSGTDDSIYMTKFIIKNFNNKDFQKNFMENTQRDLEDLKNKIKKKKNSQKLINAMKNLDIIKSITNINNIERNLKSVEEKRAARELLSKNLFETSKLSYERIKSQLDKTTYRNLTLGDILDVSVKNSEKTLYNSNKNYVLDEDSLEIVNDFIKNTSSRKVENIDINGVNKNVSKSILETEEWKDLVIDRNIFINNKNNIIDLNNTNNNINFLMHKVSSDFKTPFIDINPLKIIRREKSKTLDPKAIVLDKTSIQPILTNSKGGNKLGDIFKESMIYTDGRVFKFNKDAKKYDLYKDDVYLLKTFKDNKDYDVTRKLNNINKMRDAEVIQYKNKFEDDYLGVIGRAITKATNKINPYEIVERMPILKAFGGEREDVYVVLNKHKKIKDIANKKSDICKYAEGFFLDTERNIDEMKTSTLNGYYDMKRINHSIGKIGLEPSNKSIKDAPSTVKNLILKRVLNGYRLYQAFQYINYLTEKDSEKKDPNDLNYGDNENISNNMARITTKFDLGFHTFKDKTKITNLFKSIEKVFPGFNQLTELPFIEGLGLTENKEVKEEYLSNEYGSVRKRKYKDLVETPFTRDEILFYNPNSYTNAIADVDFNGNKYGSSNVKFNREGFEGDDYGTPKVYTSKTKKGSTDNRYKLSNVNKMILNVGDNTNKSQPQKTLKVLKAKSPKINEEITNSNSLVNTLGHQYVDDSNVSGIGGFGTIGFITGKPREDNSIVDSPSYAYSFHKKFKDLDLVGLGGMLSELSGEFIQEKRKNTDYINSIRNHMKEWSPEDKYLINFKKDESYEEVYNGKLRLKGAGYEISNGIRIMDINSDNISSSKEELIRQLLYNNEPEEENPNKKLKDAKKSVIIDYKQKGLLIDSNVVFRDKVNDINIKYDAKIIDAKNNFEKAAVMVKVLETKNFKKLSESNLFTKLTGINNYRKKDYESINVILNTVGLKRGYLHYINKDKPEEGFSVAVTSNKKAYLKTLTKAYDVRKNLKIIIDESKRSRGDVYSNFDKLKMLTDVKPYNEEFETMEYKVKESKLPNEQKTEYSNMIKKIKSYKNHIGLSDVFISKNKSNMKYEKTLTKFEEIFKPEKKSVIEHGNKLKKDSIDLIKTSDYSAGKNINKYLLNSNIAKEFNKDNSMEAKKAKYSKKQLSIDTIFERINHFESFIKNKVSYVKSEKENYIGDILDGTDVQIGKLYKHIYEKKTGEILRDKKRRSQGKLEDYVDKLSEVKNTRFSNEYLENALREDKFNLGEYLGQEDKEDGKRKRKVRKLELSPKYIHKPLKSLLGMKVDKKEDSTKYFSRNVIPIENQEGNIPTDNVNIKMVNHEAVDYGESNIWSDDIKKFNSSAKTPIPKININTVKTNLYNILGSRGVTDININYLYNKSGNDVEFNLNYQDQEEAKKRFQDKRNFR